MKFMKNHTFLCWNCHTTIASKHAGKTCPHCGASLVMEDFDALAQGCVARYRQTISTIIPLQNRLKKLRYIQKHLGIFGSLRVSPLSMLIKRTQERIMPHRQNLRSLKQDLFTLSQGRWFADPWYKASHMISQKNGMLRKAAYNVEGEFIISPSNSSWGRDYTSGQHNELAMYSLLTQALQQGKFGYARLIPNVFIPTHATRASSSLQNKLGTFTEIDMVLVTERKIYCIETKYSGGSISIRQQKGSFKVMAIHDAREGKIQRKTLPVVEQNAFHCESLYRYLEVNGLIEDRGVELNKETQVYGLPQNIIAFHEDNPVHSSLCKGNNKVRFATDSYSCHYLPRVIAAQEGSDTLHSPEHVDRIANHLIEHNLDPAGTLKEQLVYRIRSRRSLNKMLGDLRKAI